MTQKEIILSEEAEYPDTTFSDSIRTDEYTAFYFEKCIDLHEGNHAIIYPEKIKNLEKALDEINGIYAKINRKAAIFHPLCSAGDKYYNYFEENRNIIEKCGWEITLNDDYKFMTLSDKNKIKRNNFLDIKLLDDWDEKIADDIILPSGENYELESTKKFASQKKKNNLLFVGYIGNKAIIYSIIHKSCRWDCVRFDYILCAEEQRGKGYGSEMVSYIVDFCKKQKFNNCFQWAGPSENIVRKAGFCDVFTARSGRVNAK